MRRILGHTVRGLITLFFVLAIGQVATVGALAVAQDGSNNLKVMTYNIKHGKGNDDCTDATPVGGDVPLEECAVDLGRTADVIRAQDPDIVALQEVDRFWARSGGTDQPQELADMLGMEVCYGANLSHEADNHADEPHEYGVAILSAFPIDSCENTFLPTPEGWEQRGLLEARVTVDGVGEVAVLDTHLQAGREGEQEEAVMQRTEQAVAVADRVAEIDVPIVLMGDFNANAEDAELGSLFDAGLGLQDAWAVGGDGSDGNTIPVDAAADPENRIDFIFASRAWSVLNATVIIDDDTRIASDHYPVVAELQFSTEATPVASPEGTPEATPVI